MLAAADVFDQDEDGAVVLLTDTPPATRAEPVREAVARCPSGALRLIQD